MSRPEAAPTEHRVVTETVLATINGLFSAGLNLCTVRSLVDGDAADRIDRAIQELDDLITDLRTGSLEFRTADLTEHQPKHACTASVSPSESLRPDGHRR